MSSSSKPPATMKLATLSTVLVFVVLTSASIMDAIFTSCPSTLQVTVPGGYEREELSMASVHKTLLACPHTKALDLRVTLLGCSGWPDRWNLPFALTGGSHYPNLTSLKLEGYKFDESEWDKAKPPDFKFWSPSSWFELRYWATNGGGLRFLSMWRNTPVERRNMTNLQLWLEAMDWSQLTSLDLQDGVSAHVASELPAHLTGLKHLAVRQRWRGGASRLAEFIAAVPSQLESLEWQVSFCKDDDSLRKVLERHGPSLRSLDMHLDEGSGRISLALTPEQIRMIGVQAPGLRHIAVNIDRNGTWPWETLEALAESLKSLQSADIWLELEGDIQQGVTHLDLLPSPMQSAETKRHRYREPRLNSKSASEVFEFLRVKNGDDGSLRNVTFYAGDFTRPWDGPIYTRSWIEGRRTKIVCSDGQQDELKGTSCVVEIDLSGIRSLDWGDGE